MALYEYVCAEHGSFEVRRPMVEDHEKEVCPICQQEAQRVYTSAAVVYKCDGFHATDYSKHGSKLDLLNKKWSKAAGGEKPPAPAADAPRNG